VETGACEHASCSALESAVGELPDGKRRRGERTACSGTTSRRRGKRMNEEGGGVEKGEAAVAFQTDLRPPRPAHAH